jgi:hypothetical protein
VTTNPTTPRVSSLGQHSARPPRPAPRRAAWPRKTPGVTGNQIASAARDTRNSSTCVVHYPPSLQGEVPLAPSRWARCSLAVCGPLHRSELRPSNQRRRRPGLVLPQIGELHTDSAPDPSPGLTPSDSNATRGRCLSAPRHTHPPRPSCHHESSRVMVKQRRRQHPAWPTSRPRPHPYHARSARGAVPSSRLRRPSSSTFAGPASSNVWLCGRARVVV